MVYLEKSATAAMRAGGAMSRISTRRNWVLGMAMGGAIFSAIALSTNSALAQITPDKTLPNNSTVTRSGNTHIIEGGTRAGGNLFHSFGEFSVPTGGTAFFNNAADIQNIISRVTGGAVSNIDGIIRANGTANLFLINPSGIIFGRNASLNIGGSFVATTASAIGFGNQGFFSADNPNTPPLLTVNPSALLFNQIRAASIENNSIADSGLNPSSEFTATGLRVPDGLSLLLVGGDIKMDGGGLFAFGGRVELGGLAGAGTVGLNGNGNNLSLSFPNTVERSDVSLSNGARVNVSAGDGGSIAVNARNLEMIGESELLAGIESGLGSDNSKAGNISVNAAGAINLDNSSSITNQVLAQASGQGGDVNISANTLQVKGGAQVGAATLGEGKGGSLTVDAQNVQLIGTSADRQFASSFYASAAPNSTGDAGNLTIKTNTLLVRDGARVSTSTFGAGKGGSLTVDAQNVQLIGTSADGQFFSSLDASAVPNSTGDAGDLTIKTNTLLIQDGAQAGADTFASGKGGSLTVDAVDVQLIGTSADGRFLSGLGASAQRRNSTGDAGNLTIKTNTLLVRDGAQVSADTFGAGKGGSLTVDASNVQLIGESADGRFSSGLGASAQRNSTGDAGDLTIKTNTLLVRDGAQVSTATFASGKVGSLTVDAVDVQLIGTSADGRFASALGASAQPNSTGDAGDLTIRTNTLLVRDGAQVSTSTFGAGKGSSLTVDAQDVQLIGESADGRFSSGLSTSAAPNSTGDAGDLAIKTNTLLVQDGAFVTVQSSAAGTAGNMTINARSILLNNNALLSANTQSAKVDATREQATININSRDLIMRRGSNIRTNATGENVIGGNINIDTGVLAALENSAISANSTDFRGGQVRINAKGIFGTQYQITATGASPELNGTIQLNTPDVDINRGLVALPAEVVDATRLIDQNFCAATSGTGSSFTITGRGGLPPSPNSALNSDAVWEDWRLTAVPHGERASATRNFQPTATSKRATLQPIVEATGWVKNSLGEVFLTANPPTVTPHGSWQNSPSCHT